MTGVFYFHYLPSFFFRKIKMTSTDFHVEAIDRLCFVCGCILMKNGHHILLVLKEAMILTFERNINLLENVTSSNICHSCWTQVSAIQRCPLFRGFHIRFCINSCRFKKMCPLFGDVRYYHLRYWGLLLYTPLRFPSNCRLLLLKPFTSV